MKPPRTGRPPGFSLIEVVLAIGIVSIVLIAIIGLFSNVLKTSDANIGRRELAEAIDSLRRTLQTTGFTNAYAWARNTNTLLYVTYRADPAGNPATNGANAASLWIDPNNPPRPLADYDAARSGRWVRARLGVSPSNPGGTNLPQNPSDWPRALVVSSVTLDTISSTNTDDPAISSTLEANLTVLR